MKDNERILSDYIDRLNEEKGPKEHENLDEDMEMEELLKTVRMVKSLKDPAAPKEDFYERLVSNLNEGNENTVLNLENKNIRKKSPRRNWFFGIASAAAIFALVFTLNILLPFGGAKIVKAVEKAYDNISSYHGNLEITETNGEGNTTVQKKLEIWANKEGSYYVKELEGTQKDLVTVNNGQKKWQIVPDLKQISTFSAFPDTYSFTFDIGKEVEGLKMAVDVKSVGEDNFNGRAATILEVTPNGGSSYKLWIDKETKMPLQRESSLEYGIQYKVAYTDITFNEAIPSELLAYGVPAGYKEVSNEGQLVNSLEEGANIVGFTPKVLKDNGEYTIQVFSDTKTSKLNYKDISILQKEATEGLKPVYNSTLGKVNNNEAEIQAPMEASEGILGGGMYSGISNLNSVRWQADGFEYAAVSSLTLDELRTVIENFAGGSVEISTTKNGFKPQVEVPINLEVEKGDQKNADAGHSPWKLDPAFVAQVFVSLQVSPEGINGDYPVKESELKLTQNNGVEAVVEVNSSKTTIKKVYLKKVVRPDSTGIWTVVGYDVK